MYEAAPPARHKKFFAMDITGFFDQMNTADSWFILAALSFAYLLGIFSMLGFNMVLRSKYRRAKKELAQTKDELGRERSYWREVMQSKDILSENEEVLDKDSRFALLENQLNEFKKEFQDSIEFYLHSIEELTESNHRLSKKVNALQKENEQLIKAVWSDDLSYDAFLKENKEDKSANGTDSIRTEEKQEAAKNIKNWVKALAKTEFSDDDLSQIKGISDTLEKRIKSIGITSFEQLSLLDDALIEDLAKAIDYYSRRIKKEDWVGQAFRKVKQK